MKTKPSITLQYRPKIAGNMGTFWVDYDPEVFAVFEHERHLAEERAKELTEGSKDYEFRVKPIALRNPEFDADFCSKSKDGKHELDQNMDVYCRHCGRSGIHPIHPEEVDW